MKKQISIIAVMILLAVLSVSGAAAQAVSERGYASAFSENAVYYKHDIKKITFTIPKDKAVQSRAVLQFLDQNNDGAVAYEMAVQIENKKCKYVLKNFPTGRISGISEEKFMENLGNEYEWLLHLKIIFEDGTEHVYDDSHILIGALFNRENSRYDGEFKWEIRGEAKIEENDFSFVLPHNFKEFTALKHRLFASQLKEAKCYSSVDYSYWGDFSLEKPQKEFFCIGSFYPEECRPDVENFSDFKIFFDSYLQDKFPAKNISQKREVLPGGLNGLEYSVKKNSKSTDEIYFFECKEKIIYVYVNKKIRNSEIESIVPAVLGSLRIN